MKKSFTILMLVLFAISLYGQEKRVNFKIDNQGAFFRADSDKSYYVFEYDGMKADELSNLFYKQWKYFRNLPDYFEDNSFKDSMYDTASGIITVSKTNEDRQHYIIPPDVLRFQVQFMDGRVRIDVKDINKESYSAYQWIHKYASKINKDYKADEQKIILENLTNDLINEFLANIDFEEEWEDIREFDGSDKNYFSISNFKFQYPGGKDYMIYHFDGFTKEQLYVAMRSLMDKSMMNGLTYQVEDGILYSGRETLSVNVGGMTGMLKENCEFVHIGLFQFRDGLIKVYVPRVTKVVKRSYTEDPVDFKIFLISNLLFDKKGHRIGVKEKNINLIEKDFNQMIFIPLEVLKDSPKNVQREDW